MIRKNDFANDEKEDHVWKSCCFNIDKRVMLFVVQFFISLLLLAFCMRQIIFLDTCAQQAPFLSILVSIVGIWLPSPIFS